MPAVTGARSAGENKGVAVIARNGGGATAGEKGFGFGKYTLLIRKSIEKTFGKSNAAPRNAIRFGPGRGCDISIVGH